MKLSEVDWSVLRRPVVVLGCSVALAVAFVASAGYYSNGVTHRHAMQEGRLSSARTRYLALDDEKRLIQEYYPQYEELGQQGRIGKEQRLNWIETLRQAASRLKLPSLRYEIGPQTEPTLDFPVPTGQFALFESEMILDIGLFHEEDLLRLLGELRKRAAGLFSVRGCRLEPSVKEIQTDPSQANFQARCTLSWYVVNLRTDTGARPARRRIR